MATGTVKHNDGINANSTENSNVINSSYSFVRPQGPPKFWKSVNGYKKVDGEKKPVEFVIQEIPEDRYEEALDVMCMDFIKDEPMCRFYNAIANPEFVEDSRNFWKHILNQGVSVAAFVKDLNGDRPEIAAVNILGVTFKNDPPIYDTKLMISPLTRKIVNMALKMLNEANVFEFYGLEKYLFAFGLCVHPSYRGQNLGTQILDVRSEICQEYDLAATGGFFSSPISQREAKSVNFEILLKRNFDQIFDEVGNRIFSNIDSKYAMVMGRKMK